MKYDTELALTFISISDDYKLSIMEDEWTANKLLTTTVFVL